MNERNTRLPHMLVCKKSRVTISCTKHMGATTPPPPLPLPLPLAQPLCQSASLVCAPGLDVQNNQKQIDAAATDGGRQQHMLHAVLAAHVDSRRR